MEQTKKSEPTTEELLEMKECAKLANISKQSEPIASFIDWLKREKRIVLGIVTYEQLGTEPGVELAGMYKIQTPIGTLLAEYFQVDMERVEAERRAMLKHIHDKNKENVEEMARQTINKKHREIF